MIKDNLCMKVLCNARKLFAKGEEKGQQMTCFNRQNGTSRNTHLMDPQILAGFVGPAHANSTCFDVSFNFYLHCFLSRMYEEEISQNMFDDCLKC